MKNKEIARNLHEMSSLLELAGENRFRIRAYQNAAQTLDELADDVEELDAKGGLALLPGIGKGMVEKVREYCATGKIKEIEKMREKFPSGLLDMMQVSGLGPKRTRFLFDELKLDSIDKVRAAARQGRLRDLPGFGPKVEENILKGIALKDSSSKRTLLWDALSLARTITETLRGQCGSLEELVPAGSLRRWKESVGDLDFLCTSRNPREVIAKFTGLPGVKRVLAQGDTKASIIHEKGIQCDLRVVEPESFGAALIYFTGSKEHNVKLRELALKQGYTINEYGLYRLSNKKKPLAARTEEEVYKKLGLQYIPPELRENRGEIEAARRNALPRLVEEKDVRGDFHNHTRLSDGANTLEEMAARAREKGWEWFVSADHSQSLKVAHGLDRATLLKKKAEIGRLNGKFKDFTVLLGSEVDILLDGAMDYDEDTLAEIDFVVGSVHTGFKQDEAKITERIVRAMHHPAVDAIGHLTGRLIGSREAYPVNVGRVLEEAKATGTALEINGQPQRMDLYDTHAKSAGEMGVSLTVSTDAHTVKQLDYMTLAVANARRAWLTKHQILNCFSLAELKRWKKESPATK